LLLLWLQVRSLIHSLLVRIGRHHPQALMYPLLVAAKSQSPSRRQAAYAVLDVVRTHSATLVEQAQVGWLAKRHGVCAVASL
jgi:FKBP12-rapamycin complex-associated protein